jgi:thioredoxin-related protein
MNKLCSMKKSLPIALLFSFFLSLSLFSQSDIHFRELTLPQALSASKSEGKPVFFMGFTTWCPHCKKMKEQVFTDSAVADFYNSHFVCIKKDMEAGEGAALHSRFNITSFPTFIFFDSNGTTLYRMGGEFTPPTFIAQGNNALNPDKQLPHLQKDCEDNLNDAGKCYNYVSALRSAKMETRDIIQKYFAGKPDSILLSELNWKILSNGVNDITSHYFYFILHHQKEYTDIVGPERVQRKIYYTVKEQLERVAASDTAYYTQLRQTAAAIGSAQVDTFLFTNDLAYYQRGKNWKAYQAASLPNVRKYAWNDDSQLSEIARLYLVNITDTAALLQAADWAARATELKETYRNYLTAAHLYQKAGDKAAAARKAQEAKDFSMKYGWDYLEADGMLKELAK